MMVPYPRCSMLLEYVHIFTYIYPENFPSVGTYSIHGASGSCVSLIEDPGATIAARRSLPRTCAMPEAAGDGGPKCVLTWLEVLELLVFQWDVHVEIICNSGMFMGFPVPCFLAEA